MHIDDIYPDMFIRIAKDTSITKKRHSISYSMYEMCGKIFKVDSVNRKLGNVRIQGYIWAPEDLIVLEAKKTKPEVFHFNIENLTT